MGGLTTRLVTAAALPGGWGSCTSYCGHRRGFGLNGCQVGDGVPDLVPSVIQDNDADDIVAATGLHPSEVRFAIQAGDDESGGIR